MTRISKSLFALVLTVFTCCQFIFAQQTLDGDVIRIDTELVTFDVNVTTADGKFVRGLSAKDFKIFEDGNERPVEFFEQSQKLGSARPVSVVFALDVSGSMTREELEKLRGALRVFLNRLSQQNASYAIMTFGMNVKTIQSLTGDVNRLDKTFDKLLREPSGLSTHAYDAVDDAIRLLDRKSPKTRRQIPVKKSVIVVSDGFPVGDTVSPSLVIERANKADVSVFTVTLPSFAKISLSRDRSPLPTPLDVSGLTEKTGGKNVYATDKDFEPLFKALADDVTNSYIIAFYPSDGKKNDGRFHKVKIVSDKGFEIKQNRDGYQGDSNK
ncbi:MAG: VWA domain-containing protein [Pyrinomonadaceae bacterium]|nr:VWA domain-containing protein [Pyrinomonadaceae bacterium]